MKRLIKQIIYTITGISIFGILMYNISLWNQEKYYKKYGYDFNLERKDIGLMEISENWILEKHTWDDNLNEFISDGGKTSKFRTILSLKNITTGMSFENDLTDKNVAFQRKIIFLNSNILLWKNGIESELDVYENTIDSVTTENLLIRYYFKDDNGNKDYFEADYYQINENEFELCGTPAIMEREEQRISGKPYFGNITKKQADSILTKWNKNN